jgi:uncharacterized protein YdiU (UPF0061 family)
MEEHDDFSPLHELLAVLTSPYQPRTDLKKYREPPTDESGYRTFCGT